MKNILLGCADFSKLVSKKNNAIYVDKTAELYELIKLDGSYFFSFSASALWKESHGGHSGLHL